MPPIPKKAATIILLRESQTGGFEVLLLRRHEKSSFMGGNYVYPGGRVDREDGSLETCSLCRGITPEQAHRMLGGAFSPEESIAHWIAGIRELYEEAGVLLAYDQAGGLFNLEASANRERLFRYRQSLQKGEMTICQLAQEEKILFALDQLHYYAHWITPEAQPQRFDTRFFLARHPFGQEASHDQKETTAGIWLTPQKALEENWKGDVVLSPPTLKTLEDLSRLENMDAAFKALQTGEIHPVLPVLTKVSEKPVIVFPWDPEYDIFERGEISGSTGHGRPSQPGDNTTRVIFNEGRWLPYCRIR